MKIKGAFIFHEVVPGGCGIWGGACETNDFRGGIPKIRKEGGPSEIF